MSNANGLPVRRRAPMSAAIALVVALGTVQALAQAAAANGTDTVRGFYSTLLSTMMNGPALGASGRYGKLEPMVRKTFDVPFMTRLAVGPSWGGLSLAQQQQVTEAFDRYIAATYADRFDSYSGEKLEVAGERPFDSGAIVQTRIVKSNGEPVTINYLMRRNGDSWQVSDVYLDGTISELATRRSEFTTILRQQGIDGLIAALNRKSDLLSATVARAF
jgi:phospholipid transport system substrate-binding protein